MERRLPLFYAARRAPLVRRIQLSPAPMVKIPRPTGKVPADAHPTPSNTIINREIYG